MDRNQTTLGPLTSEDCMTCAVMVFWTVALFYTSMFKSVEVFLKTEMAMNTIHGLMWILMPTAALKMCNTGAQINEFDGGHMLLAVVSGIFILYIVAITYVCMTTDEHTAHTSILWSKLVMCVLFLVHQVNVYQTYRKTIGHRKEWTRMDITFNFFIINLVTVIAGYIRQLARFEQWGGYPEHRNRLNMHVRLDYIICLVFGLGAIMGANQMFAFSKIVGRTDSLHDYLCRCLGIMMIQSVILTGRAPNFLLEMPKVRLLFCRFVLSVAIGISNISIMNSYGLYEPWHVVETLITHSVMGLNALSGFMFSRFGQLK